MKKNFNELFFDEKDSNFNVFLERLGFVQGLLSSSMSKGYSYFGEPNFEKEKLKKYEYLSNEGRDSSEVMRGLVDSLNGQLRWNSQSVLHNINPPVAIDATVAACVANLYNPNPLWDFVSSGSQEMEKQVVRQICRVIEWDEEADGVFTFGGKGCLTYAVKLGLNRAIKGNAIRGLISTTDKTPIVLASEESHYSLDTVCSLLGIGVENCVRIPTDKYGNIDIDEFEYVYNKYVEKGYPIAAIVINGGNTLNNSADDLEQLMPIILSRKDELGYIPYIHYDMVITWAWLFFKQYDFEENRLNLEQYVLEKIQKLTIIISSCKYADSVGIDFHKTGFTPYISSLFITNNGAELHSIFKSEIERLPRQDYGNNFVQHHMIEHSRTANAIFSAWTSLQVLGIEGFQYYIGNLMTVAETFRRELSKLGFECVNMFSLGFAGAFIPRYKGHTIDELMKYDDFEEINNYVYQLFEYFYKGEHDFNKYVLGFLPQCMDSESGKPISGIRVFPMSAHITSEKALEICKDLGELKHIFDKEYEKGELYAIKLRPKHVPK